MIGRDKIGHFGAGGFIAVVAFGVFYLSGLHVEAIGAPALSAAVLAAGVAALAGVAKEAIDSTGRGTVDFLDFAATALGGAVFSAGAALIAHYGLAAV